MEIKLVKPIKFAFGVHVDPHPFFENSFRVRIRGEMFDLSSVSSKTLYREFVSCTFCKTNEESLEHLLFFCKKRVLLERGVIMASYP